MSGPWEQYQSVESGPWDQFKNPTVRTGKTAAAGQIEQDHITRGAKDFAGDMSFAQQVLAGAGKRFSDMWLGARQIAGAENRGLSNLVTGTNSADEKRALDKPLMETPGAGTGALATDLAVTLPMIGIPALGTVRGAALAGGGMAALNPVGQNESRASNVAVGAGLGAGGALVGKGIGALFQPAKSALSPEAERLAKLARADGIPLDAAAVTGSKPLQTVNAVLEQLPFTTGKEAAKKTAVQEGFTNAVLSKAGISGRSADPVALATQKNALGSELERIAAGNSLNFNAGQQGATLVDRLSDIAAEASKRGPEAARQVQSVIDNILGEVNQAGVMSGKNYQAWRQSLRPMVNGGGTDSHYFGQVRRALDDAFNSQIQTSGGAQAWNEANRQYANLKTILEAAGSAGNQAAQNQIPPGALAGAVRSAMGKEGNALGRGDLNDLARIGQLFVRDQIPNSGTAQRQLITSMLTTGALGGAGGYWGGGGDPTKAALGIAAGLGTPVAAQAILNNPAVQAYLMRTATSPVAGALSEAAARAGGLGGVLLGNQMK